MIAYRFNGKPELLFVLLGALLVFGCHRTQRQTNGKIVQPPASDAACLVIFNGKIWPGSPPPTESKDATALAINGTRIVFVGNNESVKPYIGPQTKVIDAGGRRVIPGMTDSHTHIIGGGLQLARLNLRDVQNRDEFINAIAADAKAKQQSQWVLGGRWSTESWPNKDQPNKSWIDTATPNTPVFLNRMDGHQALANSAALKLAGIDANGPADPVGGEIERDPKTMEPTGILKESAMDLVEKFVPQVSTDERIEALKRAMKLANSFGITSVHDMSELTDYPAFKKARDENLLTVRIASYLSVSDWTKHFNDVVGFSAYDEYFRALGFKGYADGSLGSRTAYMHEPYADVSEGDPYPRGQLAAMASPFGRLVSQVIETRAIGFQPAIHSIGDEANHLVLDCYSRVRRFPDQPESWSGYPMPRIEHAQHLLESDIPLFAKHGVVASMQPFHKADDARYAEKAIGKERLKGSYAFRQLVDAGALVIFGSDWPVVTLNPWPGIDSAVTARTLDGNTWLPDHSLTLEEALRAYTTLPAKAIGNEQALGQIAKNTHADIVILDDDPFTIPRDKLAEVKVWKTIFDGKVVFERN